MFHYVITNKTIDSKHNYEICLQTFLNNILLKGEDNLLSFSREPQNSWKLNIIVWGIGFDLGQMK